jgi:hypothetical protein
MDVGTPRPAPAALFRRPRRGAARAISCNPCGQRAMARMGHTLELFAAGKEIPPPLQIYRRDLDIHKGKDIRTPFRRRFLNEA